MQRLFIPTIIMFIIHSFIVYAQVPQLITHQGYLTDSTGEGVNATLPITFRFFADSTGGTASLTQSFSDIQVVKGVYTVVLDVSSASFTSQQWIETEVNTELLSPRTRMTSVPYALHAFIADSLTGFLPNTALHITGGTMVGEITSSGSPSITMGKGNFGSDNINTGTMAFVAGKNNRARGDYSVVSGGGGANVSDSNSAQGYRATIGGGYANKANGSISTVGGGFGNLASEQYSTIAGGSLCIASGSFSTVGGGSYNSTSGDHATVGGGYGNTAGNASAAIGGGSLNTVSGDYAIVGGGYGNTAGGVVAVIGGGRSNTASARSSTISGGEYNISGDSGSTVGGGKYNKARGQYSVVSGGGGATIDSNSAMGDYSSIAGGRKNKATGESSAIGGGSLNTVSGDYVIVGGGYGNTAGGVAAVIGGGYSNTASSDHSTVGGGYGNLASGQLSIIAGGGLDTASGTYSTVGGGYSNTASGYSAMVGGGYYNTTSGDYAIVGGGYSNTASGNYAMVGGGIGNTAGGGTAAIGGGYNNTASGNYAMVSGGFSNTAGGGAAAIGGGHNNIASGIYAMVGGGYVNYATNAYSMVPGGCENLAGGRYSFAVGRRAKANHDGTFVWADTTDADFASNGVNQFLIRAKGGVGIGTNTPSSMLGIKHNSSHGASPHILLTEDADDYARLDYKNTQTSNFWSLAGYPNATDASSSFNLYYGGTTTNNNMITISGTGIVSVYSGLNVDYVNANTGSVNPGVTFGLGSGEGISSKRNAGGNQFGLDIYTSSVARMSITSSGNIGIGNSNPDNILTIQQSSATDPVADAWTTYSSRRWKKEIQTLEHSLEKVWKLRGVSYKEKETDKSCIGLIAEEVGEIIPEVVEFEENGVDAKSVDYARLVAVLIEAIKQQQQEIDELKSLFNNASHNQQQEQR